MRLDKLGRGELIKIASALEEELMRQHWRTLGLNIMFLFGGCILGWVAHKVFGG